MTPYKLWLAAGAPEERYALWNRRMMTEFFKHVMGYELRAEHGLDSTERLHWFMAEAGGREVAYVEWLERELRNRFRLFGKVEVERALEHVSDWSVR